MARNARPKSTKFQADQNELKLKAAWLYFVEGHTQEQVAEQIGISRIKALRLLAAAREDGTVNISINSQAESIFALQRQLEQHLKLTEAIVAPASAQSEISVAAVVGHATGQYISQQLFPGATIGVGWGATLKVCMQALTWREIDDMTVVSLLGGLTNATADNPSAVSWRLADFYKTKLYQIAAPVFVPSSELARQLWDIAGLRELRERARTIDIALISVGSLDEEASIFRRGILDKAELKSLAAAGAVGDVLCHFVDAEGRLVDHPINRRVMAIGPSDLHSVGNVVISSGGERKARAIRAGIAATKASVLITDTSAAKALLELPPL
ncbi:sugar-binding transcriptional regulator [Chelatococcus asaccharovorans]|uniref:sugar-binding transcriptional regulator n=1 Tax=Chelatococcus asaccharovorans TaxID=28210 RepID=UPI00224C762C|nr:sugar-binding transcriptional regulator [Chelatococcus asaccharovorans]CAH1652362.1 DNA-binding transcriptional regulator LsrR (DeoR family) [Chelatococcus asaccharovorans]CAH1686359.1 DNA-binding transcriptional regulator LsrR (DeoR family) [Chelatococcus asaccharovorans]